MVVLLVMIMIHELGHYTAGKILKFKINEFSIGFGKAIISKTKKNGEKFSLRLIPLGGYCAFEGEDEEGVTEGSFNSEKPWKRLIVLFMGPFFNFLSAILFSFILLLSFGYADRVQIKTVNTPPLVTESTSYFKEGDVVLAVDGTYTSLVTDSYFKDMVKKYDFNEPFTVRVRRDNKEFDLTVSKQFWDDVKEKDDNEFGKVFALDGTNFDYYVYKEEGLTKVKNKKTNKVYVEEVGENGSFVKIDNTFIYLEEEGENFSLKIPVLSVTAQNYRYGFFEGLGRAFTFSFEWAYKILIILGQLITGQLPITSLGGTVTTIVTIADATAKSFANILLLVPLISINLAVFNLLPVPALDGARMVFVLIEWIRGKPIDRKIEGKIHFIGLMVLLGFVLLVDILHFVL